MHYSVSVAQRQYECNTEYRDIASVLQRQCECTAVRYSEGVLHRERAREGGRERDLVLARE